MIATTSISNMHTGTEYSGWVFIGDDSIVDIDIEWTGDPTSTLTVDKCVSHWVTDGKGAALADASLEIRDLGVTFSSNPAGGASNVSDTFTDVGARWIRIKNVGASGSSGAGTVTITTRKS